MNGRLQTEVKFGVSGMAAPLRRVAMRRPGRATLEADPGRWHYAGPIEPDRLLRQYDAFTERVAASGAEIEWIGGPADDGLADAMFPFDPSFMTPGGAILLRPGKELRQPEVASHEGLYRRLGVPVIGAIEAPGLAEGGDLMWVDESTLAAGRGFRTNQAGIDQLQAIVAPLGIEVRAFDLPMWNGSAACLHLLSLVSPLDRDLALIYPRLFPVALHQLMRERGIQLLEAGDEEFRASGGLNLNVLATAPRRCIALDGFPETVRLMRDAGCDITCFDGDALCIACEGGPTCLTLPILRDDHPSIRGTHP
ncbi:arginine deiminase family protein [Candidatus Palauibacter soopunensis]|uniref:dimethylarginine dimethylaminohydrolase family protein n=1 Tax=Candidatus Palauibacter soopunensis TaxID=3056739 RepID=UPI00239DEC99|nr:arginine deiminase family protein [Candidatus Palauibacter soopunensis]MDE2877821.1 arginine deiminase family protein [Candidatus Palauibacter soopunensis]